MKSTHLLLAAFGLLASCKENAPTVTVAPSGPSESLSRVFDATPEGEARAIHLVRTEVKPGDVITIRGRIMGNSKPFVEGRAVFILGDPEVLTPCNEIPGDECETPWDTCCDSSEDKKRGIASVQVVDADGKVLKEGVEGVGGLEKLAWVTVTGSVADGSSVDLLLINAQAIDVGE
jgi:hypothetical protein